MNIKLKLILGFVVISTVVIFWGVVIIPPLSHSLDNFNVILAQRGLDQIVPSYGGDLSEPFLIEETTRQNVVNEEGDILDIDVHVTGINIATSEVVFVYSEVFSVNRFTSFYEDEAKGQYKFPEHVEQREYLITLPYNTVPSKFVFQQNENILGLDTYQFSCESNHNDVTNSFPQFSPHTVFMDHLCEAWVEPKTGNIVDFEMEWDAYFVENGTRILQAEIGGKRNIDSSVDVLVSNTKKHLELLFIYEILIPIVLIFVGITLLTTIILFQRIKIQKKMILNAREELVKKEKLSSIGEISARIAHDIRNPISVINMAITILDSKDKASLNPKTVEFLPIMKRQIHRITHQLDEVLGFVGTRQLHLKNTNIIKLFKTVMSTQTIPENIEIDLPKNDVSISCDSKQMNTVFANILLNAIQSIGKKQGKITISLSESQNEVTLTFEDTGVGIPQKDISRIFEPLFTTKQNGTGLGLVSCKTIIEQHGGKIIAQNRKEGGAIFTIILPKSK